MHKEKKNEQHFTSISFLKAPKICVTTVSNMKTETVSRYA